MANNSTIETGENRLGQLNQARNDSDEASAQQEEETTEEQKETPKQQFIGSGEAIILIGFTGMLELLQWGLDFIPFLGWAINAVIAVLAGLALIFWVSPKTARGAPKSWYWTIILGGVGSALPIIPGYLGAIIYLIVQDRGYFPGALKLTAKI